MKEIVALINNKLRSFGREAIQESKVPGRGVLVGYRPQYILDAVNAVLGPENWRYEVAAYNIERHEGKPIVAWVMVRLFIRKPDGEWLEKGQHFGHASVTIGAVGDSLKAATTDAIGKAFSTMSIGRDAYSGDLGRNGGKPLPVEDVYGRFDDEVDSHELAASPEGNQQEISPAEIGIPTPLLGIMFVVEGESLVATETVKGALYDNKDTLKSHGFKWDKQTRRWVRPLPEGNSSHSVAIEPEVSAVSGPVDKPEQHQEISPAEVGMPTTPGIMFVLEGSLVVATETVKGALYNNRSLLKQCGFRWDKETRKWVRPLEEKQAETDAQNNPDIPF